MSKVHGQKAEENYGKTEFYTSTKTKSHFDPLCRSERLIGKSGPQVDIIA
jgi:hypothetical protein